MRKTYILPFLRSAAVIIAVSLSSSCHHAVNNETADILEDVESYINEWPDSALTVIQSIGAEDLSSRELKARHALLLSQALDKNFIDLQSDSIIAPAVKFFEKSGDREALFKAYSLVEDGKTVIYIWPVEDPDRLDTLRKSVGLMPIEDYLEIVKQQGVEIIYDKTKTVKDFK